MWSKVHSGHNTKALCTPLTWSIITIICCICCSFLILYFLNSVLFCFNSFCFASYDLPFFVFVCFALFLSCLSLLCLLVNDQIDTFFLFSLLVLFHSFVFVSFCFALFHLACFLLCLMQYFFVLFVKLLLCSIFTCYFTYIVVLWQYKCVAFIVPTKHIQF